MFLKEERHIAHLDLDAFFVSVECKKNSKLLGKPLLVGGSGDRGVVAACSYETRKFGIHSAMPMKLARRLCPEALVIKGDMESYSAHSKIITDIIASKVPLFEKASIDEFYVDLSGMERFFGSEKYTAELKKYIVKEAGLPISYGLSANKLVSKVATNEIKPNGQLVVASGNEKSFLAPLAIHKMPGIGKETGRLLMQMGVENIDMLSRIPPEMLHNLMGKNGIDLWRKANGIDETPVIPYREQKSISTENTFSTDTTNIRFLETELLRMTESIAFQLRTQNKLAGCISVKIRYANFDTVSKQSSISYTGSDHLLIKRAKELFRTLYDKRLLVRLIGVRFSDLIPGNYQINLFDDSQEMIRLYKAIDGIKNKYGVDYLTRGAAIR